MVRGKRWTIQDMQQIANELGGKCLSDRYHLVGKKLRWKCKDGHEWTAPPNSVLLGHWCPYCSGYKLDIAKLKQIAKLRGGECLSDKCFGQNDKLRWRCAFGHEWVAIPNSIMNSGTWCPLCNGSVKETICRHYFQGMFETKFDKIRPAWLKNLRGARMELDGYSQKHNLAFEYNGQQHYNEVKIFSSASLKLRKEYDEMKHKMCKDRGIVIIDIPYHIPINAIGTEILKLCRDAGIEVPTPEFAMTDYRTFQTYHVEKLNSINEIAESNGGRCLSKNYINSQTKLKFRCKDGHEWMATPASISFGSWCPVCAGKFLNIEDMKKLASEKGGKCLSDRYVSMKTKLEWECSKGHRWLAEPNVIRNMGHWCRECSRERIRNSQPSLLNIGQMRELAASRGGKCLSEIYINTRTPLEWECAVGHSWWAQPSNVKGSKSVKGTWCPICANEAGGNRLRELRSTA